MIYLVKSRKYIVALGMPQRNCSGGLGSKKQKTDYPMAVNTGIHVA